MLIYNSIVFYFIIVLFYFRFHNIERNKLEKFIFCISIPFFGFVAVALLERKQTIALLGVEKKEKDEEKENSKQYLTKIQSSLIDNIIVNDYETVREMILSIKSMNFEEQCKVYRIAIKSKNMEISHVAAISLMRIQNYYEQLFTNMELNTNLSFEEDLKKYIDEINQYMKCKFIHGALYEKYSKKL